MEQATLERGLRYSIYDGAFATAMGSLTGGIFLMGFALKVIGATPTQVGLLAALPMLANVVQMLGSYIIERTGRTKGLCIGSMIVSRILWVLVILLPLAIFSNIADYRVWVLVVIIAVSSVFGSLAGVAWLAWMSDLVPAERRGTYFGRRNMIASTAGMVVTVVAGKFLTSWNGHFSDTSPFGFVILFAFGVVFGMVSSWFVARMPEPSAASSGMRPNVSLFVRPLKDANFLRLIVFVSVWTFGVQLAGPFYNVYMIDDLRISFQAIALLSTLSTLTTLLMMRIWGPISDSLGNRPIIVVSTWVLVAVPIVWVIAPRHNATLALVIAFALSGAFMAGASLSQFNILIKLSPREGRSAYLALFAAMTGIPGAVAPVVGGALAGVFSHLHLTAFGYHLTSLHMIFLLSGLVQATALVFLIGLHEPEASRTMAVVMRLKNDLNPQTGIVGTADFVLVELRRGRRVLETFDQRTEAMAERSEASMSRVFDAAERLIKRPLERLKNILKDDEE